MNDDFISRQKVLDYIHRILNQGMGKKKSFEFIQKYVEKLPSVNPQEPKIGHNTCYKMCDRWKPKTGHWEWVQYDYNPKLGNWHCSECRSVVIECVNKEDKGGIPFYKYCPQCGARMIEPQESEGEE